MFFSLFNLIMFLLDTLEALNLMVLHIIWLPGDFWYILHKAHHCLWASWVKLFVVCTFDWLELVHSLLSCLLDWVLRNFRFDIISIISNKSHSIFELNVHCLVIDGSPFALDNLGVTLLAVFAKNSFGLIVVHDIYAINIEITELEIVTATDQLNFIWGHVGAELVSVEQVDAFWLFLHFEVPNTEGFLSEAVHRLISLRHSQ